MADPQAQLVLYGREFDGFSRSFQEQFAVLGVDARVELVEITELERLLLSGAEMTDGSIDLVLVNTDWLPSLISDGRLLALSDRLASDPPEGWPDAWVPSLRDLQTGPDGGVYGLAYHDGPMMFLYRTDLYDDASEQAGFVDRYGYGLAPPRTWEEYLDHAHWFDRPESGLRGTVMAGLPDQHNNIYDFLTHLWSRGGELVLADGTSGLGGEAAKEAITFLDGMWHTENVMDPAAAQWDSVQSGIRFAAGEAAMMVNWCGFAALSGDPSSPTYGTVGAAPAPGGVGPEGQVATMNAYWVLAIAAGCRQPDVAYRVIRDIGRPAMDLITARSLGSAVRRDTWMLPEVQALAPYYAQLESAHNSARAIPRDPRWPQMAELLNDLTADVIAGTNSLERLARGHSDLTVLLGQPVVADPAGGKQE